MPFSDLFKNKYVGQHPRHVPLANSLPWKLAHASLQQTPLQTNEACLQTQEENLKRLTQAFRESTIFVGLLGDTGSGKTTTVSKWFLDPANNQTCVLVCYSNQAVKDAETSLIGLIGQEEYMARDGHKTVMAITDNKKGWYGRYREVKRDFGKVYLIINVSFWWSCHQQLLSDNPYVVIDEVDSEGSGASVSSIAEATIQAIQLRNSHSWSKIRVNFQDPVEVKTTFDGLRKEWIEAGGSFKEKPTTPEDYQRCLRELLHYRRPFKGKLILSSATFPEWVSQSLEDKKQRCTQVRMEKPANPRAYLFMDDSGQLSKCQEHGALSPLYNVMVKYVTEIMDHIIEHEPTKYPDNSLIHTRAGHSIGIPFPGDHEISTFMKVLKARLKDTYHGNRRFRYHFVTKWNLSRMMRLIESNENLDDIFIWFISPTQYRGCNFNIKYGLFPGGYGRGRHQIGNRTDLLLILLDLVILIQIVGRFGRRGESLICFIGDRQHYESMMPRLEISRSGLIDMLMVKSSMSWSHSEFQRFQTGFQMLFGTNLTQELKPLVDKGLLTLPSTESPLDEHIELTREGNLYTRLFGNLDLYLALEKFLLDHQLFNRDNCFRIMLWVQFINVFQSGSSVLMNLPETLSLMEGDQRARRALTDLAGHVIDHPFMRWWFVVDLICDKVSTKYRTVESEDPMLRRRQVQRLIQVIDYDHLYQRDTYRTGGLLFTLLNQLYLDIPAIKEHIMTALQNIDKLNKQQILPPFITKPQKLELSEMNQFWKEYVTEGLGSGKFQLAVRRPEGISRPGLNLYMGSRGNPMLIKDAQCHNEWMIVISTLTQPTMDRAKDYHEAFLGKRPCVVTVAIPIGLLFKTYQTMELLHLPMMEDKSDTIQLEDLHQIQKWLIGRGEAEFPFQLDSNVLMTTPPVTLPQIKANILNCLKHLNEMRQTLGVNEKSIFAKLFEIYQVRLRDLTSQGGTEVVIRDVPSIDIDIINYETDTYTHHSRVFGKYVLKQLDSGEELYEVVKSEDGTFGQKFMVMPEMESPQEVQSRQEFYDMAIRRARIPEEDIPYYQEYQHQIESRHCCAICQKVESTSLKVGQYILVHPDRSDEKVLVMYHPACLDGARDTNYQNMDPISGWLIYEFKSVFQMTPSPETHIKQYRHWNMTDDDKAEHAISWLSEPKNLADFNRLMDTSMTLTDIAIIEPAELVRLHHDYVQKYREEEEAKRRRVARATQKEAERRQKEARRVQKELQASDKARRQQVANYKQSQAKVVKTPTSKSTNSNKVKRR